MDIDVRNAYTKALRTCGSDHLYDLLKLVYQFISEISIKGGEDRFCDFCNRYVQEDIGKVKQKGSPENISYHSDVTNFFMALGKHYLFNEVDRRDVDKDKIIEFIKELRIQELRKSFLDPSVHGSSNPEKERGGSRESEGVSRSAGIGESEGLVKSPESGESEGLVKSAGTGESEGLVKSPESGEPEATEEQEEGPSLEELKEKLHAMIGLQGVKEEVEQIINLISVQRKGLELGLKQEPLSLHLVFYGNPGTGKTTVARLLAKIYKVLGVLSEGQLVEVDRGGLVGGYIGQTAIKTQEVIDKAMGGILFIDEAYALTHGKGENDFGQEAVDTILKAMEDHREDFVVIVAGYPDLMKEFISSNPGLKSRFNQYIQFEDYSPQQLLDIFKSQCKGQTLVLADGCDEFLKNYFTDMYEKRDENFANGRDVRNYFEKVIRARVNRLSPVLEQITAEQFRVIELADLEKAKEMKSSSW